MTISYVGKGADAAITTSASVAVPTGLTAGDLLFLTVSSDSTATPGTPSGWTLLTGPTTGGGLTTTAFVKVSTGSESGFVTVSGFTSGTKGIATMVNMRSTTGTLYAPSAQIAVDSDTSSTAVSATGSSWTLATGDMILAFAAMLAPSASYTSAGSSSPLINNASVTETSVSRYAGRTGTNTIWYNGTDAAVTAGGTGAPTYTATMVGANGAGTVTFIKLTESSGNVAPVANAGPDQTVALGAAFTLNGSGSTDSDGTVTGYAWTQPTGTAVTLSSSTSSVPTATAPSSAATLGFSLVVTDNLGATSTPDTVTVTVKDLPFRVGEGAASAITTATTPGYPTVAANDRLVMWAFSNVNVQPANPAGWGTGTTVAGGAGGMYVTMWSKVATGTETGTVTITGFTGGTKGVAWIAGFRTQLGTAPYVEFSSAFDSDTSSTTFSATGSSWTVLPGDVIAGAAAMLAPSGSYSGNMTSPTVGTIGSAVANTARLGGLTASSTIAYAHQEAQVTSTGGATGTPFFTATGVGANAAGAVGFARITTTATGGGNASPTANAGADQNVNAWEAFTLNGSGSTDSDGTVAGYAWTQTLGTTVTLSSSSVASPTATAPGAVIGGEDLTFSLVVTDNLGATSTPDTVTIHVASATTFYFNGTTWKGCRVDSL